MMDLTAKIKELTETIKDLSELESAITTLFSSFSGAIIAILILLFILVNHSNLQILDRIERHRNRKIEKINEYIASPVNITNSEILQVAKEHRDSCYFKFITGINEDGVNIPIIIETKNKLSYAVTWIHFRRAQKYFYIDNQKKLNIKKSTIDDKISYYLNLTIGLISSTMWLLCLILLSLLFFTVDSSNINSPSKTSWHLLGLSLFTFIFSIYAFSQNWPLKARNLIDKELQQLEESSSDAALQEPE